mmetsp:Transcript_37416/g.116542  ORF Transcript_37416/g.116542 Transcript_37416/m.116542 type:complete len:208 (-) Transcript_37416:476-1099(-)
MCAVLVDDAIFELERRQALLPQGLFHLSHKGCQIRQRDASAFDRKGELIEYVLAHTSRCAARVHPVPVDAMGHLRDGPRRTPEQANIRNVVDATQSLALLFLRLRSWGRHGGLDLCKHGAPGCLCVLHPLVGVSCVVRCPPTCIASIANIGAKAARLEASSAFELAGLLHALLVCHQTAELKFDVEIHTSVFDQHTIPSEVVRGVAP